MIRSQLHLVHTHFLPSFLILGTAFCHKHVILLWLFFSLEVCVSLDCQKVCHGWLFDAFCVSM